MSDFEMDELLIRSLQGRISQEEAEVLARWRARTPDNAARYERLSATWRMTGGTADGPERSTPPAPERIIRAAAEGNLHDRRSEQPVGRPSGRSSSTRRRTATAAMLVATLGLGYLASQWLGTSGSGADSIGQSAYSEITTGEGERTTVTLTDGTAVRLGPLSTLRFTDEGDSPVVWLEGHAYFGVHPDPSRTFTVETPYGEAVALGTRFSVRTENDEFQVLVLQGDVRIRSGGASLEIGEGLMTRSLLGGPPTPFPVENVHELLDWMGPVLVFRETPLSKAIAEIAHRYGAQLELADSRLADRTVTGTFTYQTLGAVVLVVCEVVGAECIEYDGAFRIGTPSPDVAVSGDVGQAQEVGPARETGQAQEVGRSSEVGR